MSSNTGKAFKVVHNMGELLTQLLQVDVANLPEAAQLECLQALQPVVCRLEAVQLRLVGAIDKRGTVRPTGSVSTAAWLRNVLRVPNATGMVKSAAALSALPTVSAAFAAGQIGNAHVATIAKVVENVPPDLLAAGMEHALVDQARHLPPSKFAPVAARIRNQAVPPAEPPADKPEPPKVGPRWMRADRGRDGSLSISGVFDARAGDLLLAALRSSVVTRAAGRGRDLEVRRADALLDICRRAMAARSGSPAASPAAPTTPASGGSTVLKAPVGSTECDASPAMSGTGRHSSTLKSDVSDVACPSSGSYDKSSRASRRARRRKRHRHPSAKW